VSADLGKEPTIRLGWQRLSVMFRRLGCGEPAAMRMAGSDENLTQQDYRSKGITG
jgi:hypothetical protein